VTRTPSATSPPAPLETQPSSAARTDAPSVLPTSSTLAPPPTFASSAPALEWLSRGFGAIEKLYVEYAGATKSLFNAVKQRAAQSRADALHFCDDITCPFVHTELARLARHCAKKHPRPTAQAERIYALPNLGRSCATSAAVSLLSPVLDALPDESKPKVFDNPMARRSRATARQLQETMRASEGPSAITDALSTLLGTFPQLAEHFAVNMQCTGGCNRCRSGKSVTWMTMVHYLSCSGMANGPKGEVHVDLRASFAEDVRVKYPCPCGGVVSATGAIEQLGSLVVLETSNLLRIPPAFRVGGFRAQPIASVELEDGHFTTTHYLGGAFYKSDDEKVTTVQGWRPEQTVMILAKLEKAKSQPLVTELKTEMSYEPCRLLRSVGGQRVFAMWNASSSLPSGQDARTEAVVATQRKAHPGSGAVADACIHHSDPVTAPAGLGKLGTRRGFAGGGGATL
jgi:hypothetical protein